MKVDIISDIHLDVFEHFGLEGIIEQVFDSWFKNAEGEILLVAGDVETCLGSEKNELSDKFFDYVTNRYNMVFCVLGNHDYWNKAPYYDKKKYNFETMVNAARKRYPRVVFLNADAVVYYEGFGIIGATMWTNVPPHSRYTITRMMNDYSQSVHANGHMLTVDETSAEASRVGNYIFDTVSHNKDTKFIVLTHHVPFKCYSYGAYDVVSGYAFVNDFENEVMDNPNIKLWAFGHTHYPVDKVYGECRLVCNPHGYINIERRTPFKVKTIEV